jgi:hypothetical protein
MASVPSFICGEGNFVFEADVSSSLSFFLYELSNESERYILAAALEGAKMDEPEMRWFSEGSMEVRKITETCTK